jgi:hypothetical protein
MHSWRGSGVFLSKLPTFQRFVLTDFIVSSPAPLNVTEPAFKANASRAAMGQDLERMRDQQVCGEGGGREH